MRGELALAETRLLAAGAAVLAFSARPEFWRLVELPAELAVPLALVILARTRTSQRDSRDSQPETVAESPLTTESRPPEAAQSSTPCLGLDRQQWATARLARVVHFRQLLGAAAAGVVLAAPRGRPIRVLTVPVFRWAARLPIQFPKSAPSRTAGPEMALVLAGLGRLAQPEWLGQTARVVLAETAAAAVAAAPPRAEAAGLAGPGERVRLVKW